MKKILSLTLAIMLVLSLSVPAMAADQTLNEGANQGSTTVKTTIAEGFIFTIPGETTITALSTEAQNIGAVTMTKCNLQPGEKVTVSVSQGTALTAGEATIAFTPAIATTEFDAVNESGAVTLTVTENEWANKPAGEYTGAITFTFTAG